MNESSRRYAAVSGGFVATVLLVVLVLSLIVGAGEGIQYTLDSLAYGSLFAVMALGLALLFNVMGLMNFAYGELIMAGAYTMFFTRSWGWLGMILMTVLIVTILSLLMELIAFRPVRNASPVVLLVTSFAVSYGIQQLAWTDVFGLAHRFDSTIGTGPQKGVEPYPWLTNQFDIGGVLISRLEIATFIVTGVLLVGLTLLLKKTTLGIQLRASSEDFRMAQLTGVRANWVISAAFGITGVLAGAVSILVHPAHRRRLARHRPGAAVRRLRRRGDRRSRKPRRRSPRRIRPGRDHQRAPGDAADHAEEPHAALRVPRGDRDPRPGPERPRLDSRGRGQASLAPRTS